MKVVSWNGQAINDGVNYTATLQNALGLPGAAAQWVARLGRWPLVSGLERPGRKLTLGVALEGQAVETLRAQLQRWLDPEDETPKALVVEDDDGGHARYVLALCEALQPTPDGGGLILAATLAVHGDVRWRSTSEDSSEWNVTASGQTRVVSNDGQDEAYPRLTLEPTSNKSSSYSYKRFVPVRWRVSEAHTAYPVDVCDDGFDTAALVTAGKVQADGDDLRVWVDGVEVSRWLAGMNTATTQVWVNLDFQAKQEATLATAMGSGDAVTTLEVNEDIADFPSSGILMIDSEAFTYSGKNDALQRFSGVSRAAKGTTAASHSSGATVWWCQHEVWLLYGNPSAGAPAADSSHQPLLILNESTNQYWLFEPLGTGSGSRPPANWAFFTAHRPDAASRYTKHQGGQVDPWTALGIELDRGEYPPEFRVAGYWQFYHPAGVTEWTHLELYKWRIVWGNEPAYGLLSSVDGQDWTVDATLTEPPNPSTWTGQAVAPQSTVSGARYLRLSAAARHPDNALVEIYELGLTLDGGHTPLVAIGAEQSNYVLDCLVSNTTTGDAIRLRYTMALNEELEVDTAAKTVTDLEDGSRQFQALALVGGARRDWLPLQPGSNTLRFDDVGTAGVTVTIEWEERYY